MNTITFANLTHEMKNVCEYMGRVMKKCNENIGYDVKHTKLYLHADRCLREADQLEGVENLNYKEKDTLKKLKDKLEELMYDFETFELI